jgi:hypothetical protein
LWCSHPGCGRLEARTTVVPSTTMDHACSGGRVARSFPRPMMFVGRPYTLTNSQAKKQSPATPKRRLTPQKIFFFVSAEMAPMAMAI